MVTRRQSGMTFMGKIIMSITLLLLCVCVCGYFIIIPYYCKHDICDETNPSFSEDYDYRLYSEENFEVWYFEGPIGKWWIGEDGEMYFILFAGYGELESHAHESYIIKYLVENEIKTIIRESTDKNMHVIFIDENSDPYVKIATYRFAYCNCNGTVGWINEIDREKYEIWVYIPRFEAETK